MASITPPLTVTPGMTDEEKFELGLKLCDLLGERASIEHDYNHWHEDDESDRGHYWYATATVGDDIDIREFYLDDRDNDGNLVESLAQALDDYGRQFFHLASELRRGPAGEKITLYRVVINQEDGSRRVLHSCLERQPAECYLKSWNSARNPKVAVIEVDEVSVIEAMCDLGGQLVLKDPTSPVDAR